MKSDEQKSDGIFARKSARELDPIPEPPAFLPDYADSLRSTNEILDLACGDGAVSLALAKMEKRVTGLDISSAGLARLQRFARETSLDINLIQADLDPPHQLFDTGVLKPNQFSALICYRFKLSQDQIIQLLPALKPGGLLLLASFNLLHHKNTGFNLRYCLQVDEYVELDPCLSLVSYRSIQRPEGHFDEYLFNKVST